MGSYLSRNANIVIHGQCSPADTLLITSVFDSTVKYMRHGVALGFERTEKKETEWKSDGKKKKKTVAL